MRIARIVAPEGPRYASPRANAWVPCTDPFEAFAAGHVPNPQANP